MDSKFTKFHTSAIITHGNPAMPIDEATVFACVHGLFASQFHILQLDLPLRKLNSRYE